jgi:hypothetical protein
MEPRPVYSCSKRLILSQVVGSIYPCVFMVTTSALHVPAGSPIPVFTRWSQIKNRPCSGNPEFMIQKTKKTHLLLSSHAGQSEM